MAATGGKISVDELESITDSNGRVFTPTMRSELRHVIHNGEWREVEPVETKTPSLLRRLLLKMGMIRDETE